MSRIFFAELRRLVHYRLYHAACAAVVLFSLFYAEPPVVDRFLFYIMIVIGAFSAVCVSQFIGVEYSCGTIRNKLVTGHTRTEIYLAQLVLHILAAVILFHISILTIVIAGALFNWTYDSSVQILIVYYIACMCTIVLITAVSVFVSMQSSSTMASFVILLLLYAGLSMLGTNCHGALLEQEIQMTDTSQAGNPPEKWMPGSGCVLSICCSSTHMDRRHMKVCLCRSAMGNMCRCAFWTIRSPGFSCSLPWRVSA